VPRDRELGAELVMVRSFCSSVQGQNEEALYDCDRALECNPRYVKAVARRSTVFEKFSKLEEALADAELWVALEPKSHQAKDAASRLKKAITERDEKLKEEMLGKLKDMGNWVLGKFGMSLDNFKAVQDPKTGSYSINFQR
jgi:tetratricopeptide (TPR) repeat protein